MKKSIDIRLSIILSAVIALSVCLCGCTNNEKGFTIPVSPDNKSVFEMCTTMYNEVNLNEIYNAAIETETAEALDKKFPVQCLRKSDDGYQVMYASTNEMLILNFDKNAKFVEGSKKADLRRLVTSKAVFDELKVGDSVHLVQAIDHHSYIPFMAGVEGAELSSDHFSEDGYHTHIEYDSDHKITSIETTVM
ncbi:MAG: hypothetical protein IJI48_04450 [Ruminococcus sp.]|nr:hypothetical protein [Ruminococcus sp.]